MVIGVDLNSNAPGKDLCDRFYNVGYDDLKALVNVGKNERFSACDMVFTAAAQFAQKERLILQKSSVYHIHLKIPSIFVWIRKNTMTTFRRTIFLYRKPGR